LFGAENTAGCADSVSGGAGVEDEKRCFFNECAVVEVRMMCRGELFGYVGLFRDEERYDATKSARDEECYDATNRHD
jgi:hypothetical protein